MDRIFFKECLNLCVYTIGYSKEGESIVITLEADEVVVYTIVIDGYKVNSQNISCEILKKKSINRINMFCWSHPDDDHSTGIEDYLEFIDKESVVVVGNGFFETKHKWEKANKKVFDFISCEIQKPLNTKNKVGILLTCMGKILKKILFIDARNGKEYLFEIDAFAPNEYCNLRRNFCSMDLANNDISVGISLKLGNVSAVFCADIPNVVFNNMQDDCFPEYVDFIKIPHHCSKSSDKLLNLFKNEADIACTTVNTANKLPDCDLLKKYKMKVKKLYCTNDLRECIQSREWGVIQCCFKIDGESIAETRVFGNAEEVVS